MSQENVEIARRAIAAFAERDVEAWVEFHDADVELLLPRNILEGGSYKGHEGIRRAFADAYETWEEFRFDLQDIRVIEDRAVWLGRTTTVGKGETPTIEFESAYLVEIRGGKIVYFRPFQSQREALEAAGLRE
jgi:uncharacterized protein